jgi:hypothetical protein
VLFGGILAASSACFSSEEIEGYPYQDTVYQQITEVRDALSPFHDRWDMAFSKSLHFPCVRVMLTVRSLKPAPKDFPHPYPS